MLVAERYRVDESLGRGGMGEVYRGFDRHLERSVAIKLLLPGSEDAAAAERFRREARAAAMISDPHVVAVYDFGNHQGSFYLVMELVEGHSVSRELTERGPLPADRALDIIRQAAAGLAAAHWHDIVHRDIKPSNLLIAADGTVKVADFGIARFVWDTPTALTTTGELIGTSQYLAPERAIGGEAGPASDVYALGCVLYQLVTGRPPFLADQPAAIMYQHVETDPLPPSALRPELAGPFEELLLRMLSKDPAHRPTAAQVAAGVLPDLPVLADAIIAPADLLVRHPSRRLMGGGAAALVAVAGVAGGFLFSADAAKLPPLSEISPGRVQITKPAGPSAKQLTTPKPPSTTPTPTQPRSTGGRAGPLTEPRVTVTVRPVRPSQAAPTATPSPPTPSEATPTATPTQAEPTPTPTEATATPTPGDATPTPTPGQATSTGTPSPFGVPPSSDGDGDGSGHGGSGGGGGGGSD